MDMTMADDQALRIDIKPGDDGGVPTDREKASQYRTKATIQLTSLCKLLDEAKADGFIISYGTGDNAQGEQAITKLDISFAP
jgi:hypothetical protein